MPSSSYDPSGHANLSSLPLPALLLPSAVFINFVTPFRQSPKSGARWVYDSAAIARNYLRSSFAVDVLTAVPIDTIVAAIVGSGAGSDVLRLVPLLRLVKMLRLFRLSRIMRRWISTLTIDLSLLELIKLGLATAFCAHW